LAQQGPPPRRPGRHSAPDPEPGQYDAQPYDDQRRGQPDADPYAADPYADDPYAADPYAAEPRPADPARAQPPYGSPDDPYPGPDPYAPRADPYAAGADPYRSSSPDPYASRGDSYGSRDQYVPEPGPPGPGSPGPYGAGSHGADPYGAVSRAADSHGADPYGAGSRGADSHGADPYSADSYRLDSYQPRRAAAPSYAPPESPAGRPEAGRPEPPRVPVPARAAPAAPSRRAGAQPGPDPGRGAPWAQADPFTAGDDDEDDLPPWAGLTIRPARAAGTRARPERERETEDQDAAPDEADGAARPRRRGLGRGRAAAARLRKSRRRVYVYCGTAVVLAVAVAGYLALRALPKHTPAPSFITTLQPGEFATVPAACNSVSPALLASYLPGGPVTKVNPAGTSASLAQCSFTVDHKPVFRVLNVTAQAYQPSAVAAGNGSATANAVDNFVIGEQTLRAPGKKSAVPPAAVTLITGLGTEAFRAVQVIHAPTGVNDLVTVMARQRNLVVTVTLQAQASGGGFGPVDAGSIEAGALAVARAVLAHDISPAAAG
jgi:hypothetical protein